MGKPRKTTRRLRVGNKLRSIPIPDDLWETIQWLGEQSDGSSAAVIARQAMRELCERKGVAVLTAVQRQSDAVLNREEGR